MTPPISSVTLNGVFPVLPTPFDSDGEPDVISLRRLVRYLIRAGVDGLTYPGVASEFAQLSQDERVLLLEAVLDETADRIPVVAGVTSADSDLTLRLATHAAASGARALMVAAPPQWKEAPQQIAYFQALSQAVPGLPLMLQNVPPPVGAGLDPEVLIKVVSAVPAISYIKEEALPSGQRLTKVLVNAPASLKGVLGGAGGRYITDELRRGACGTMPAIELAEVHVALYAAHRKGDSLAVRKLFTRMLPILNIQAVFRWALTKHVLLQRGLINHAVQRVDGPRLDDFDRADINDFMNDLSDLLMPAAVLAELRNPG